MRFVIFLCLVAQVFSASFPAEPQTGGAFCGSDPPYSCCEPNAQGGCDCSASRCTGGKLIYLPKYFRTTLARNNLLGGTGLIETKLK